MINSHDNISNSNEYEQNQGNFINQGNIRQSQYIEQANFNSIEPNSSYLENNGSNNFRLDEYHKNSESFNNYQFPTPKYQDIDQLEISQNENGRNQMDLLYKRENNELYSNRNYKNNRDENKNYIRNSDLVSDESNSIDTSQNIHKNAISYPILNNQSTFQRSYKQSLNMTSQQDLDYSNRVRYGEQSYQTQPNAQNEYRQHQLSSQFQYETQPQRGYYNNDSYSDIPPNSSTQTPSSQLHHYNQRLPRYNDSPSLQSASRSSFIQNQYRSYPQNDFTSYEIKQDILNPIYQAQQHRQQFNQYQTYFSDQHPNQSFPQYSSPPPQQQFYSQQPFPQQSQQPLYRCQQIYEQTSPQRSQMRLQQQQMHHLSLPEQMQYNERDYSSERRLIYNHEPNVMHVDIPPSGRFAKPKLNKLQQRFNCRIISEEIANVSPDDSFQDNSLNEMNSSSISEYNNQSPLPTVILHHPRQDPQILPPNEPYTYQNNQYSQIQPQSQYSYLDRQYQSQVQMQDENNYHQNYMQDTNQSYNQEINRSPSPSDYFQQQYSSDYPSQECPPKDTNSYYQHSLPGQSMAEQQPQQNQQQYYNPPNQYQYSTTKQTMPAINTNLNENGNNRYRSPEYPPDSNSYSESDDQTNIRQYQLPSENDEDQDTISDNEDQYEESDNDNSLKSNTKSPQKENISNKIKKGNNPLNDAITVALQNSKNTRNDNIIKNNKKIIDVQLTSNPATENIQKNIEPQLTLKPKENKEKEMFDLLSKKKNNFKPQRYILKVKVPSENADESNPNQETIIKETQGTFIKKGRGVFLRPKGFDEAIEDETLIINPYTAGFQPQSYWESTDREVTFGQLVTKYFTSSEKIKVTKFVFKLYNMLIMTEYDERFKDLVGFNWFSDYVISVDRLFASAMLNLSTTNYDVILPQLLDNCGFIEVTPENYALPHLKTYPGDEVKGLKLYYHHSFLFTKKVIPPSELERMEIKKTVRKGRQKIKYPAHS